MAKKQRKYNMEYKVQAVKLAKETGGAKAAAELGIPENTMYGWTKAVREGRLDIGSSSHTTHGHESGGGTGSPAHTGQEQEKENRRLKEKNEFLEEAILLQSRICLLEAFSPPMIERVSGKRFIITKGYSNRSALKYSFSHDRVFYCRESAL